VTAPAAEELDRLLELQQVDSALRRLRHHLSTLDEQRRLDEAHARHAEAVAGVDLLDDRLGAARREQQRVEGEVSALTHRRDEERLRLYEGGLASAREIHAVEAEIASTERRIGEHEDELLTVMERVEVLEAEQRAAVAVRESIEGELVTLTAARDGMAEVVLADIAQMERDRAQRAQVVPLDLLARYEEAAARGSGVGIGVLEHNACTACGNTFATRIVSELLAGPSLALCPQCQRLLVIPS
jgi:uncharacterized protein